MPKPILALLLLAPGLALAQTPFAFTLKGRIGQVNAPAKVFLRRDERWLTDSATVKNGFFELKGTANEFQRARLWLVWNGKPNAPGPADQTEVFLEPNPVLIISPDSLQKAKITGSPLAADFEKLKRMFKPLRAKERALDAEYDHAPAAQQQSPAFSEHLGAAHEALLAEGKQLYAAFIRANPASWVSLDVLSEIAGSVPQFAELNPLYQALSPALKRTPQGRKYAALLQALQKIAIGQPAPAFTLKTPAGKAVSLSDYRGKYVLIDFWASWCSPCREENPAVAKAYQTFKGRRFDILGVSLDEANDRSNWLKAIADDHLPWPQVSDLHGFKGEVAQSYHVQAIPQNFLIDPSGKIVAVDVRGDALPATLARFLK